MINLDLKGDGELKQWILTTDLERLKQCGECKKYIKEGYYCKINKEVYCNNCEKKVHNVTHTLKHIIGTQFILPNKFERNNAQSEHFNCVINFIENKK